ncbi:hypothetical protein [Variovorax sp. Sphag1AA]|uniref:hypothetical protein n=1 Tax=Variovorax sp. Sphag1AA TaxID=2587027 RepID=UPI001616400D|nr:hypothetical protein [Variovorax sp. Sphag1AA]MBB3182251.1 TPR repeat protein [Variovorax sp. Sphag1AA]
MPHRAIGTDPRDLAPLREQRLLIRYGVSFIDESLRPRAMRILRKLDNGSRLARSEFALLSRAVEQRSKQSLARAYHLREASHFAKKFRRTGDPWTAVNASSCYRRGGEPHAALEIVADLSLDCLKTPAILAALCTTKGGVMRDLGRLDEALRFGELAHRCEPSDYRPCTLLGATHIERGNLREGLAWYQRAAQRGADVSTLDEELRAIFAQALSR